MTNNNGKRIKKETYLSEDQQEIKRFILLLIIIVILILGVYFFTRLFVTKDLLNKDADKNTVIPGSIDYNAASIGSMLSRHEKEYYVIMYDSKTADAVYYGGLVSTYKRNKDALKVYLVDLNNELNKKYIDKENVNVNTNNLEEFKVGVVALLKVENGKITSSFTKDEDIQKELEYKKDTEK